MDARLDLGRPWPCPAPVPRRMPPPGCDHQDGCLSTVASPCPEPTPRKDNRISSTQDYQAAEQLLRRPARPGELVIGDKVRPQWIDGGARFWYAVSNGVGRRFVLVDPAAGTREPAFDHALLAAALAAASGQQVDPEALPFMAIELAGNAVEFDAFGEHWRCRLDSYACERAEFTPPGNPLEVPSPDKKVAVSQPRARPVGALAGRRPRVGADHRRRARLPVRLRPGLHEQRHPAAQVRPAAPAARGGLVARLDEGAGASDR